MASYTQTRLISDINRGIQNKISMLLSPQDTVNEAVREVKNDARLRSAKREVQLVPNLLTGDMEYVMPSDLEGQHIIDIPKEFKRHDGEWTLVPLEQYERLRRYGDIAIDDKNGIRVLRARSNVTDQSVTVDPLTQVDSGGQNVWDPFGSAENVENDAVESPSGSGWVEFDIGAAVSTAAGLEKDDSQTALDLSNFIAKAARAYVYARLTSAEGVEGFEIRFGTTANDYFRFIATTQNDATVFVDGINFVSFDLRYPGVVGSPDWSNIAYRAVFIKKDVSKVEEGGYAFNLLQVRSGIYATIRYYSLFGWRNQNGTYKVESDQPTDIVVAQQDEYDLYVKKGRALAARETDLPVSQIQQLDADYQAAVESYNMRSIDESKAVITSYFEYGDDIHEGYPQVV